MLIHEDIFRLVHNCIFVFIEGPEITHVVMVSQLENDVGNDACNHGDDKKNNKDVICKRGRNCFLCISVINSNIKINFETTEFFNLSLGTYKNQNNV